MNVYNITVVVMHLSRWYDMAKSVFFMCIYLNWQAHLKWISHAGEICTCFVFFYRVQLFVCVLFTVAALIQGWNTLLLAA